METVKVAKPTFSHFAEELPVSTNTKNILTEGQKRILIEMFVLSLESEFRNIDIKVQTYGDNGWNDVLSFDRDEGLTIKPELFNQL